MNFEDVRPYYDNEVSEAVKRISENVYFPKIVEYIFPGADVIEFTEKFRKINSIEEFQVQIMYKVINNILERSVNNLSYSGTTDLTNDKNYMFISNHRDIMLDSAILQLILYESGINTSEITFGDNLMFGELVVDIGKINKMFKIIRGGTPREIFANSLYISKYMHYAITEKHQSVWIAQRNGRTKDGNDETDVAVLKMFSMSSKKNFVDNLYELNITPVSVSYEYEPCDFFKTREIYISRRKKYEKEPGEDLNSILHGVRQWKGNVHISVCNTITKEELEYCDKFENNDKFKELARVIDRRIFTNYKLWKTNYIAHDLLNNSSEYSQFYTYEEKEKFVTYMSEGLKNINGDTGELENIFLKIYATVIDNFYSDTKI
jgi:hypothetical protein